MEDQQSLPTSLFAFVMLSNIFCSSLDDFYPPTPTVWIEWTVKYQLKRYILNAPSISILNCEIINILHSQYVHSVYILFSLGSLTLAWICLFELFNSYQFPKKKINNVWIIIHYINDYPLIHLMSSTNENIKTHIKKPFLVVLSFDNSLLKSADESKDG